MYCEEASSNAFLSHHFTLIIKSFGETENDAQESFISPFLASLLDGVIQLQRTTKNSLSRAGLELAFSGFSTAALPIKLSNQLELVASLFQIEQRSINPNMRVEMPLETTNFSLFCVVSD